MDIKGKNTIVTGAGQGIGRASALMMAKAGARNIVVSDINAGNLLSLSAEIEALGSHAITMVADVSKPEQVIRLFDDAEAETGGLDIVHNNAGIMAGSPDFPDTIMEKMILVIQVNLIAMMVGTKHAVDKMRARGATGVIVNTASIAAFNPMPADPAYAASKIGILRFTESCAPLFEQFGIRVMAICPGVVDTAIVPHDAAWLQPVLKTIKMLQPADIANGVKAIIEDDSLTGTQITVSNEAV